MQMTSSNTSNFWRITTLDIFSRNWYVSFMAHVEHEDIDMMMQNYTAKNENQMLSFWTRIGYSWVESNLKIKVHWNFNCEWDLSFSITSLNWCWWCLFCYIMSWIFLRVMSSWCRRVFSVFFFKCRVILQYNSIQDCWIKRYAEKVFFKINYCSYWRRLNDIWQFSWSSIGLVTITEFH